MRSVVGKLVSRVWGTEVAVRRAEMLSPRVKRIVFEGEALHSLKWTPGDKVKLAVGPGILRSYTPAAVDREAGTMDVLFHLHGGGPAALWAAGLRGGEKTSFMGPARSMRRGPERPSWAAFFGDETALGLAQALIEALPAETPVYGAIEIASQDAAAVARLGLPLDAVMRRREHGTALLAWLNTSPELRAAAARESLGARAAAARTAGAGAAGAGAAGAGVAGVQHTSGPTIWLSGEAGSVLSLRRAFNARGLFRPQLCIKPYWSVRGTAHRKKLEREALVA